MRRMMMTLNAAEGLHPVLGASARLRVGGQAIRASRRAGRK